MNTMNTRFQTTTISDFLDLFAGRRDMDGYDDAKPIKIAECNRDFVWPLEMQQSFISSILQGFPIPAMCITNEQIVDGGNRSTTLWRYKNGQFGVKDRDGVMMLYDDMCGNRELTRRWESAVIPQQIITNATPDQFAQIYENLNKGISLTFGQLLKNRNYRPWVALAEAMIGRGTEVYADRELLHRVWTSQFKKTKNLSELGTAFQILVGAERGSKHYHLSFMEHLPLIMGDTPPSTGNLKKILKMFVEADPDNTVSGKIKKDIFKKFIGAVIYDFHNMGYEEWKEKWVSFLKDAYNTLTKEDIKRILNVGNLRGLASSRIKGVSTNVRKWMDEELIDGSEDESSISYESEESE